MDDIKKHLANLVRLPSVTPLDMGCQDYMVEFLKNLGYSCQRLNQGPVSNFFASIGVAGPLLVFAGHTDVVPVGDLSKWATDPFVLVEQEGMLYGRGVADMKGSLAAMLAMASRFAKAYPTFKGRLGFLITSGEEGDDFDCGTPYVMEQLQQQGIAIDYCIVGEPSSTRTLGDVIKIGRRGSLSAHVNLHGKQGHVAYPHLADNPIHKLSPALAELAATEWDQGNAHFPPTTLQVTSIHSDGHAGNIIPGGIEFKFNIRYSTEQTADLLKKRIEAIFAKHELFPHIEWRVNGHPFLTDNGPLLESCKRAIKEHTGKDTELSTNGGTSDGRFIAPYGVEVVELGPVNATIHQVNESVSLNDLAILEQIYFAVSEQLLT